MKKEQLNQIFEQARSDIKSGMSAQVVSTGICEKYNLNWMFVAPIVLGFK